jgi:predicted small integral membrane protein
MRRSRAQIRSWWRAGIPVLVVAVLLAGPSVPARAAGVSITAVSPAVAAAGATVTVTGEGFSATAAQNAVTVNGKAAAVSVATATRLSVVLPTGVTSGPVRVVSPAGSATSPSDVYVPPSGFAVADVEQTRRLAYGTESTAAVATSGKVALLTIAGQAGHRLSVRLSASTFGGSASNARASIFRPDGTALVAATGFPTAGVLLGPVLLPADGTYQVLVDPQSTAVGQVAVTAYDLPADAAYATTPGGDQVVMTTTVPGQDAVLNFPATAGQRLFFAFTGGTFSSLSNAKVTVRRPDGTALIAATNCGTSCEFDTTVAPVAGTYTVLFDPQAALTGSLTARVYGVPADATATLAVGGAARTVTTATPGQNAILSFPGTAGDRVYFTFTDSTYPSLTSATVTVRRPDGSSFVSAVNCGNGCTIDVKTLPDTGTYTILLDPRDDATGALTAQLTTVAADATATLTAGGPARTVATTTPGQNAAFSFAGTAGQRVFLNFTGGTFASSTQAKVTVSQPDGTALVSGLNCGQSCVVDTRSLPVAGTYTILVDPQGAVTGSLTAQLHQVPADLVATATAGGPAQQVVVAAPGQNASVTFAAEAGQRVSIQLSGSTFGLSTTSASVTVLKPDGTALHAATGLGANGLLLGPTAMPASGTYTVTLNPAGALTGAVAVRVFSVADAALATTPGGP